MAKIRRFFSRFGSVFSGVVVVAFFLPFFNITCAGIDVLHWSGFDMVHGGKPAGQIVEMAEGMKKEFGDKDQTKKKKKKKEKEIGGVPVRALAIVAFGAALVMFGLGFVKRRQAVIACAVLGVVGFGSLIGLYVQVKADVMGDNRIAAEKPEKITPMADQAQAVVDKAPKVEFGTDIGFWVANLGFLAVAVLGFLAAREPDELVGVAVGGQQPGPAPPM